MGDTLDRFAKFVGGADSATDRTRGAPTPLPSMPGTIGKYRLLRTIGQGGMGVVYEAEDPQLKRRVALKLLREDDPQQSERFLREAQTAARLSHPNIVAVYETGEADGRRFIAMQLIEGDTLADHRCPAREAARLIRDAALAVQHAHELGIVHRDLKPANIMLEERTGHRVFVMDFGLARTQDSKLSASGVMAGTPAYMSPEQAHGRKVDARTDVYGLGATLYELLAGRPPFEAPTVIELIMKVVSEEARPPDVQRDLRTIVMKCLAKEPARRYPTAAALGQDLDRWLGGEPIAARPASVFYRLSRQVLRRKAVALTAAVGVLVAVLLVTRLIAERGHAERREAELKELGGLWMKVVLAKQGLHNEANAPERVRHEIEGAVAQVSQFIARHPDRPQGYYVRARGRTYLNDLSGAEADLRRALAIDSTFRVAQTQLAIVLLEKYLEARYRIRLDPDEEKRAAPLLEEAARWLIDVPAGAAESAGLVATHEDAVVAAMVPALHAMYVARDRAEAKRQLESADARLQSADSAVLLAVWANDADESLRRLDAAVARMPHFARARLERAHWRSARGDLDGARADLDAALAARPDFAEAHTNRAVLRRQMGDPDGAIEDCNRAAELEPGLAAAYVNRAAAWMDKGELDRALADVTRTLELAPELADAYNHRANIRLRRGDPSAAIVDFTRAIEVKPDFMLAWAGRASARAISGDIAGARADADKAMALSPRSAWAYLARGRAFHSAGDPGRALDDFTQAITLDSRCGPAYLARGSILDARGRAQEALADYTRAIELVAHSPAAFHNRGCLRSEMGDLEGAEADYTSALALDPNFVASLANRGAVREALGERRRDRALREAAAADLRRALQAAPPGWADRQAAETALRRIEDALR